MRRPGVVQHHHSAQQVSLHLALKLRTWLLSNIHGDIVKIGSVRLVHSFQAINERPALNGHAPGIVRNSRIRGQHLDRHFHLQLNHVACSPTTPNR